MIDEALRTFLERGCAMVVGTADADGTPHAQRAWGCSVLGPTTIRVLLDAEDPLLRRDLAETGRIAITSADVRVLRSVQLKGRLVLLEEELTDDDRRRCDAHNVELFEDIEASDHLPSHKTRRMTPPEYIAAVVEIDALFDQTPGPRAGSEMVQGWSG